MQITASETAAPLTPFQNGMWEAARSISYGLQVFEPEVGEGADFAAECAVEARATATAALKLDAPAPALQLARQGIDLLGQALTSLHASDEDGYPTQAKQGEQQLISAMNLFGDARDAATNSAPAH